MAPNPFVADNRHGALQDVTGDNQVNFGDTFLGDLLGVDGAAGLQGRAGMLASMGGARREQAGGPEQSARPQVRPDVTVVTAENAPIDNPMAVNEDAHPLNDPNTQGRPVVNSNPSVNNPGLSGNPEGIDNIDGSENTQPTIDQLRQQHANQLQTQGQPVVEENADGTQRFTQEDAPLNPMEEVPQAALSAAALAALVATAAGPDRQRAGQAVQMLAQHGRGIDGEVLDAQTALPNSATDARVVDVNPAQTDNALPNQTMRKVITAVR